MVHHRHAGQTYEKFREFLILPRLGLEPYALPCGCGGPRLSCRGTCVGPFRIGRAVARHPDAGGSRSRRQPLKTARIDSGCGAGGGKKLRVQPTSRPPWPRAAESSASSSCPGERRTVSGTWPISAPILAAAFSRSNRSGASLSASTNPSIRCSALSGMISDIQGKSRSFWQATKPCGASRPCCPPNGARLHQRTAQCLSGRPIATLVVQLNPARPAGTTSRTDTRRGLTLVGADAVVASFVVAWLAP